jgi:4-amino-4-deoxy-L-arabinose transferase-like glycosyltransferase
VTHPVSISAVKAPRAARTAPATRPGGVDLAGVALLAFLPRAILAWFVSASGLFSDMVDYHVRAELLLEGQPLPDAFRGPGYPLMLAALYALPGDNLLGARLGNAVMAAATAVLATALASRFGHRRAAIAAGLIVALYPASVLSSAYVMPEGFYGLVTLSALAVGQRLTPVRTVVAGLLTGLAALTRPLGLAVLPSILAGTALDAWRRRRWLLAAIHAAMLALSCLLILSPWLRHTSRVSGAPMLDSSSAYNFLLGANPRARERLQLEDVSWVWETYLGGAATEVDRNRRALAAGWTWVRANPLAWTRLVPVKMAYLWGLEGREHAWAYSNGYFGARGSLTVRIWGALLLACLPPLVVLAVIGALRPGLASDPLGLSLLVFLALVTLLHGLSFSETRFHLPMIPILAVLAARGASGVARLTPLRWFGAGLVIVSLAAGWVGQWAELAGRYERLTAEDGWQTGLPF